VNLKSYDQAQDTKKLFHSFHKTNKYIYVCNNERSFLAVISALLDSLNDKDQNVRRSVIESIERISKQNPEIVVQTAIYFWEMHKKVDI